MLSSTQLMIGGLVLLLILIAVYYIHSMCKISIQPNSADKTQKLCLVSTVVGIGNGYLVMEDGSALSITSNKMNATKIMLHVVGPNDPDADKIGVGSIFIKSADGTKYITVNQLDGTDLADPGTNVITYEDSFIYNIPGRASMYTNSPNTDYKSTITMGFSNGYFSLISDNTGFYVALPQNFLPINKNITISRELGPC